MEKKLDGESRICKPKRVELITIKLFADGKRAIHLPDIAERRSACLARQTEFGGLEGLIDSEEKYPVYFSQGVHGLFSLKYKELFVQK